MMHQHKREKGFLLVFGSLFVLALLFNSCGGRPRTIHFPEDLVWPKPPDNPRIKFIASVSSEEDVGGAKRDIKDIILGRDTSKTVKRLRKPYGVCTDAEGRIYVADSPQAAVFVFDRKAKKVDLIGRRGSARLSWPIDVVLDEERGNLFVSDVRQRNVFVYNPDGTFKFLLGRKGDFINPTGLALERRGGEEGTRVLVVDSKAHDIKVYTTDGKFVTKFGQRGGAEGRFNFPTNAAVGKDGYIYVVDTGNHRIQVFDQDYNYYDDFGTLGNHPGEFRRPKGIALDSDNHIYIVDSDFNNFQVFNQEYLVLLFVGRYGRDFGQFWLPAGIHVDQDDRIYVVDSVNRRVQIFQYIKEQ
jgi:DNA-binding beta-propeller fold protein YncE